ncbi:MAG: restriction endonuclease subunit S [Chloroflexi bacterium]|nr:restriction endonuclease subunit S [Chloroflexota bacterium]
MVYEWRDCTLGDVVTLQRGFDLPKSKRQAGEFPIIASTGIVGTHDECHVRGPGVVIGRSGSIGGGQFIKSDFWPLNTTLWVKDFHGNDKYYCYLLLKSLDLARFNAGSGVPTLNRNHIHPLPVSLPPLPEQRAIAHILGALDDKIELNRRMNETLEAIARALFKSWFVDFDPVRAKMAGRATGLPPHIAALFPDRLVTSGLGEIPEGWGVCTLGQMCHKPQYGYTASAQETSVGPKFLRIKDINKSAWIRWEDVPYCQIDDDQLEKYQVQAGDVLIARMADPGHGVVIEKHPKAVFASYLIRFQPIRENYVRYIQFWMRSNSYWELVKSRGTGTTRRSLNAKVLSKFPVILPSNAVLDLFQSQAANFRGRIVANTEESFSLANLRDALLPKLMSGELRLRDADSFLERAP